MSALEFILTCGRRRRSWWRNHDNWLKANTTRWIVGTARDQRRIRNHGIFEYHIWGDVVLWEIRSPGLVVMVLVTENELKNKIWWYGDDSFSTLCFGWPLEVCFTMSNLIKFSNNYVLCKLQCHWWKQIFKFKVFIFQCCHHL